MSNSIPSRSGQINATGDDKALFLKTYAGEVLTAFVEDYKLSGRITERNIDSGKSASFPAVGTVGSEYHVPGAEILGTVVEHNEVIVTLDPMLIAHAFIANIDEAMNHYDVRSEYTRQQGLELSKRRTMNELRCAIQAARVTSALVPGQPGGALIKNTTMATSATVLAAAFRSARQLLDEKEMPDMPSDYTGALRPAQYYLLTENKDLIDRDFNTAVQGSYNEATIASIARIPLLKTNYLPNTNESAAPGVLTKYRGDYSNVVASIFHRSAVSTLKLMDLSMEDVYQANRQGTLMLAKFALGHGPLRSAGAIELSKAP